MSYATESNSEVDDVIERIKAANGVDYSPGRAELLRLFDEELFQGNYSASTDFDEALGLPDLRLIQEDEYEQSMDEDEKPDFDSQICYAGGHYVFPT